MSHRLAKILIGSLLFGVVGGIAVTAVAQDSEEPTAPPAPSFLNGDRTVNLQAVPPWVPVYGDGGLRGYARARDVFIAPANARPPATIPADGEVGPPPIPIYAQPNENAPIVGYVPVDE
jgi:hypothetical protein